MHAYILYQVLDVIPADKSLGGRKRKLLELKAEVGKQHFANDKDKKRDVDRRDDFISASVLKRIQALADGEEFERTDFERRKKIVQAEVEEARKKALAAEDEAKRAQQQAFEDQVEMYADVTGTELQQIVPDAVTQPTPIVLEDRSDADRMFMEMAAEVALMAKETTAVPLAGSSGGASSSNDEVASLKAQIAAMQASLVDKEKQPTLDCVF